MRRSRRRRLLLAVELAGVGLLGALLAIAVAGKVTRDVGPFQAALSFQPSLTRETEVAVPPLGELRLDTHDSPVRLEIGVTRLRPDAAPTPVTLSVLYLDPDSKQLQAYDDITPGGIGASEARISRQAVVEPPAATPSPTPTSSLPQGSG